MEKESLNTEFLRFLKNSPTPFHAVLNLSEILQKQGFRELQEKDAWNIKAGDKFYVQRNGTSLVVCSLGSGSAVEQGFRIVGAHSDSPCLKIKPQPEVQAAGNWKLGVEVYGGVLLSTWFDRDLSVAGRVICKNEKGQITQTAFDWKEPIGCIPNLAIHLNRNVNKERSINEQVELPLIWTQNEKGKSFKRTLEDRMGKKGEVLSYDLFLYDVQSPGYVGLNQEYITSARLDNLASCFIGCQALLSAGTSSHRVLAVFDHEEVGSRSATGAQSGFLEDVLLRVCGGAVEKMRAVSRSVFVSADNAHGLHPNYLEKHEAQHAPILNAGPVIKNNANQNYGTNAVTSAFLQQCFQEAKVSSQQFVMRSDLACGSTVGPIVAANLGVSTVDVGIAQWAMHSCRETIGSKDIEAMCKGLSVFYGTSEPLPER